MQVSQIPVKVGRDEEEGQGRKGKNVSFDNRQNVENRPTKKKDDMNKIDNKKTQVTQNTSFSAKERSRSANHGQKRGRDANQDVQIRDRIRDRER